MQKNKSCLIRTLHLSRKHDEHVDTVCAQAPDVAVVRHCQECTFHVYKLVSGCLRQFISDFRLPIIRWMKIIKNETFCVMRCLPSLSRFVTSCGTVLAQISCSPYYLYWRNPCSPCLVSPFMHLSCCSAPNGRTSHVRIIFCWQRAARLRRSSSSCEIFCLIFSSRIFVLV